MVGKRKRGADVGGGVMRFLILFLLTGCASSVAVSGIVLPVHCWYPNGITMSCEQCTQSSEQTDAGVVPAYSCVSIPDVVEIEPKCSPTCERCWRAYVIDGGTEVVCQND